MYLYAFHIFHYFLLNLPYLNVIVLISLWFPQKRKRNFLLFMCLSNICLKLSTKVNSGTVFITIISTYSCVPK